MFHGTDAGKQQGSHLTHIRRHLALSTAIASFALIGYGGRAAYAGSCLGAGGIYSCSLGADSAADVTQVLSGAPLTVTTTPGFGIDTSVTGGNAITLQGTGGTTFIDLNNATITGQEYGIHSSNTGNGALSITTTGQVFGHNGSGIYARNSGSGTDLNISTNDSAGGTAQGIHAINEGNGALSITASGEVVGFAAIGILVENRAGTDLTVTAERVSSYTLGIGAYNEGSGALSITASGVSSDDGSGVFAKNSAAGTDLTVTVNDALGNYGAGIEASNNGSGSLTVTNHDASAQFFGIRAYNRGGGALTIESTGYAGSRGAAISAYNDASGTDMTITAVRVNSDERDGILARNFGTGTLSVTASGAVYGGNYGAGIVTETRAGGSTVITLNDGASVSATSGVAITNDAGDSDTTVKAGASVTGEIRLGDGRDNLTFNGGNFSGVTQFDGGANTNTNDTLTFRNVSGSLDGNKAINWENVVIGGGGSISLSGALATDTVDVEDGGTLGGTGIVQGNLSIAAGGSVGPGNSAGDLTVDGDFALASGANAFLEVEGTSLGEFDRLLISGDLTLEGDVVFQVATGVTADIFETTFDVFDFFVEFDPTPAPVLAFDITDFQNANYFFQSGGRRLVATLLNDGRFDISSTAIPEPGTLALFGSGLLGLFGLGRARRRSQTLAA